MYWSLDDRLVLAAVDVVGWLAGWLAANTERDQLNDDDSS
jgi:hypothetical protein